MNAIHLVRAACFTLALLAAALPVRGRAEIQRERWIGPGVRHVRIYRSAAPVAIQVVEADTAEPHVHLGTSLPSIVGGGVVRLSAQAARATGQDRYPIAGVNGDYYLPDRGRFQGLPIGASIAGREILHSPYPRSALILNREGPPRIAILRMYGWVTRPDGEAFRLTSVNHPRATDGLVFYTHRFGASTRTANGGAEVVVLPLSLPLRCGEGGAGMVVDVRPGMGNTAIPQGGLVLSGHGAAARFLEELAPGDELAFRIDFDPGVGDGEEVIGGGPRLVRDGLANVENEANVIARTAGRSRQPRTAVGIRDGKVFLVTVDGRRRGYSAGMTLWELARFMRGLGCTDAMALDGGGSTTMWVRGAVRNWPSYGRERAVANGLLLFSTAPPGPPAHLTLTASTTSLLAGGSSWVRVSAEDRYYNPVAIGTRDLQWTIDPPVAIVDAWGRLSALRHVPASGGQPWIAAVARAEAGEGSAELQLRIYLAPPRLEVTPGAVRAHTGAAVRLSARSLDERGRLLLTPSGALEWSCPRELGRIDPQGLLRTAAEPCAGWVTASVNGKETRVPVQIGTVSRAVADFEDGTNWRQQATAGNRAPTEIWRGAARSGAASLRLRYVFTNRSGSPAAYARTSLALGNAVGVRASIWGDGSGGALRAKVRDSTGRIYLVTLAPNVTWRGVWREVAGPVPAAARGPLALHSIYFAQPASRLPSRGALLIDHVRADYRPPLPEIQPASLPGDSARSVNQPNAERHRRTP